MKKQIKRCASLISDNALRQMASYASVAVASVLIIVKIYAYVQTGSVALLSSTVDSAVDLLASLITAYGVWVATRPPDRDHRYGHGKAESLAALAQAAFITVSSVLLVKEAIGRFVEPQPLANVGTGYTVMALAIGLTLALLALQSYTIVRTKSLAIASDRLHYVGDVLINLAVVATFVCQGWLNVLWIDPAFALAIAAGMMIGAIKIARLALKDLMDSELPEKDRAAILACATAVSGVCGAHDLRTRTGGGRCVIEIHVEMNPDLSLKESHKITEAVSTNIQAIFPKADVLIHQDPFGHDEARLDAEIEKNDPEVPTRG